MPIFMSFNCYLTFRFSFQTLYPFPFSSIRFKFPAPFTHCPWIFHWLNIWRGVQIINLVTMPHLLISSYIHVAKNCSTCRSQMCVIPKFKISLHATVYWYGRIWYKASIRSSSGNLSLQNVAVCDVDVLKGENAVRELQTEYGADRVIFIKTDVTNVAELEGNVETIWMIGNFLKWSS